MCVRRTTARLPWCFGELILSLCLSVSLSLCFSVSVSVSVSVWADYKAVFTYFQEDFSVFVSACVDHLWGAGEAPLSACDTNTGKPIAPWIMSGADSGPFQSAGQDLAIVVESRKQANPLNKFFTASLAQDEGVAVKGRKYMSYWAAAAKSALDKLAKDKEDMEDWFTDML